MRFWPCRRRAVGSDEPVALANVLTLPVTFLRGCNRPALARSNPTSADTILVEREPGREPLATVRLAPGARAVWDGRFLVTAGARLSAPVEVRALANDGLRQARSAVPLPPGVSADALRALPGFWHAQRLISQTISVLSEEAARGELPQLLALTNTTPAAPPNRATVLKCRHFSGPIVVCRVAAAGAVLGNILYTPMLNSSLGSPTIGVAIAQRPGQRRL